MSELRRQSIARSLIRQLKARLELEKSLGSLFANICLPQKRDLTTVMDQFHEPESITPAKQPVQPMSVRQPKPATEHKPSAPASSRIEDFKPASVSELGKAAGVGLGSIADLPPVAHKEDILATVRDEAVICEKCHLCKERKNVVFGEGNINTDLVFVGEAPGRDEDMQGKPFVGRAGKLLTDIIVKGMKRSRDSVYICNILKCRPPRNRDPEPVEVLSCTPYLHEQLTIIRPKLIIALGRISAQILSGERLSMRKLRGRFFSYRGIPLLPVYHPAYLLRAREREGGTTEEDRETWNDIQKAMAFLDKAE